MQNLLLLQNILQNSKRSKYQTRIKKKILLISNICNILKIH